ncbi:MAG: hypothetical protein R3C61_01735 [Bacteroidia bacterium]
MKMKEPGHNHCYHTQIEGAGVFPALFVSLCLKSKFAIREWSAYIVAATTYFMQHFPLGFKNKKGCLSVVLPILVSVLIHTELQAQADSTVTFALGYYGNNLWNTGLSFDTDYIFRSVSYLDNKGRTRVKQRSAHVLLGGYSDPYNYDARFVQAGFRYRVIKRQKSKGLVYPVLGVNPLGIYRSFLPSTYSVSPQGTISKVFIPGRWYYSPSVSAGLVKAKAIDNPTGFFARIHLMALVPYNTYILPLLNIEVGYQFHFLLRRK